MAGGTQKKDVRLDRLSVVGYVVFFHYVISFSRKLQTLVMIKSPLSVALAKFCYVLDKFELNLTFFEPINSVFTSFSIKLEPPPRTDSQTHFERLCLN